MMSELNFDPYHKWLGIPPAEQPPNHYRLLGIPLFERDEDVIENAATRQIEYLRTFAVGPNAEDSQELLNEVSLAKVTLLNPPEKEAYDQSLILANAPETQMQPGQQEHSQMVSGTVQVPGRGQVSGESLTVGKTGANADSELLLEFDPLFTAATDTHSSLSTSRKRSSESGLGTLLVGGGVFGLLLIVSTIAFFLAGKDKGDSPMAAGSRRVPAAGSLGEGVMAEEQRESSQQSRGTPKNVTPQRGGRNREIAQRPPQTAINRAGDQKTDFVRLYVLVNGNGDFNFNVIVSEEEIGKRHELFSELGKDITQGEFLGYAATTKRKGLVPLYRYRTRGLKRYLFCKERRTDAGSQREKLLGWVSPTPCENGATIFRLRETKRNRRRITTNVTLRDQRLAAGDDTSDGPLAYTFVAPRLPDMDVSP